MKNLLLAIVLALAWCLPAGAVSGDVNGDGEVSISDVNTLIDLIATGETSAAADVNGDGEVSISDVNVVIDIILGGSIEEEIIPKEILLDDSELTEPTERIPEDEDAADYEDYVENTSWSTRVYITLNGETATVTGNPAGVIATINGAHVTITSVAKRVKYIVSGATSNGSLKFYSERKFQIQLDGVDITNPNGAAINNQCGKSLYLVMTEGKVNTLRDGENYEMVDEEDQKGTIFSEGQILVSGKGLLNVYSVGRHCMVSDDYIFVRPGSRMYLNSTSGHGIKAKDYVYIKGGVINMEIAADGGKGINCDSLINITGGRTTIINTGSTKLETDSLGNEVTTAASGLKSDCNITMKGGKLNIKCTGDDAKGVNMVQPFVFTGGELNVVCTGNKVNVSPKGIKCDSSCSIQGGYIYSCAPNGKALDVEEDQLTIADGYTTCNRSDARLMEISY